MLPAAGISFILEAPRYLFISESERTRPSKGWCGMAISSVLLRSKAHLLCGGDMAFIFLADAELTIPYMSLLPRIFLSFTLLDYS